MAASVDQKLLRQTKFPADFNQKVDMQKVNVEVMKKWIASKISEILGSEDDVVIELCFNLLEGSRYPNIKVLQIQLTGFLEKDTATFCKELWTLCLSAQSNPQGVPKELLEAKKLELIQEKIEAEKAAEIVRRRRDQERTREREVENLRRERPGRGDRGPQGRGRDGRDARGGGSFDHRAIRNSRSPRSRPRRDSNDYGVSSSRREVDTYIPPNSSRGEERHRRPRIPSKSPSRSISRTPPSRLPRRSPRPRTYSRSPSPRKGRFRSSPAEDRVESGRRAGGGGNRGNRRGRSVSLTPSRSRSPRTKRRRRTSRSDSPIDPPVSRRDRREKSPQRSTWRSISRSRSRSPRSPTIRKDMNSHTNATRDGKTTQRHRGSSRSESRSPRPRTKRRRSLERYDSRAKRRRNTSSIEPDESSVDGDLDRNDQR